MKPNSPEFRDLVKKLTSGGNISLPPLIKHSRVQNIQPSVQPSTSHISHVSLKKGLSGIKDVDLKILDELNDKDLFSFCLVDKHVNKILCKDEHFWRARFVKRFGNMAAKYKPNDRTWRNHYLKVVQDIDVSNPWEFFRDIYWTINSRTPDHIERFDDGKFNKIISTKDLPEKIKNQYWMLELGNKITILYQIDRYDEMDFKKRTYKSDKEFTPAEVIRLVYNFYQEPLTRNELEIMQDANAEYAEDYTLEDADAGKVKRIDLMGGLVFFEGFRNMGIGYELLLGS